MIEESNQKEKYYE